MARSLLLLLLSALALLSGCAGTVTAHEKTSGPAGPSPELKKLKAAQAQFAPVEIRADLSGMPENERKALAKLVEAAQLMDALFLRQVWAGNEALLLELLQDETPVGRARVEYFLTQKGPWDRTAHDEAFIPGVPPKPPEANYYPAGAKKEEVAAWIESLPAKEKEKATGFFYTIRRTPEGRLTTVPYSIEYQGELELAARLLEESAALTKQPTLAKYLKTRAAAFRSNDYFESDIAWMELDASIEPTIGPYENYEDHWFNYKAAFEAFITVRDDAETEKLEKFGKEMQWLEDRLPIAKEHRNPKLGALAPIRVVNQIYATGDANRGVKTAAFNLPNDERVHKEKGSKRTMLKNVQEAKFQKVLLPISKVALGAEDRKNVDFDAFFTFILMHEVMHGLGPHTITVDGKETSVRKALKEASSAFEEAKADISGLWALQQLVDKGVIDEKLERTMYDTYLAGAFRTLRFGVNEAHGKGMALQLNYLLDKGAVETGEGGTFVVNDEKIKQAVADLTGEMMTIQANGDYDGAKAMLARLGVIRPEVKKVLDRLESVPVDIAPRHVTAEKLLARRSP